MNINKISVIIPCYNEEKTIEKVINEVNNYNSINKEIILVDDGAIDQTRKIIESIKQDNLKKILR